MVEVLLGRLVIDRAVHVCYKRRCRYRHRPFAGCVSSAATMVRRPSTFGGLTAVQLRTNHSVTTFDVNGAVFELAKVKRLTHRTELGAATGHVVHRTIGVSDAVSVSDLPIVHLDHTVIHQHDLNLRHRRAIVLEQDRGPSRFRDPRMPLMSGLDQVAVHREVTPHQRTFRNGVPRVVKTGGVEQTPLFPGVGQTKAAQASPHSG